MRGQLVRVVARRAGHRENAPGLRLYGHRGAVVVLERLHCGRLQLGIDGRLDAGALVLLAGEQRLDMLPEQCVRFAGEQLILGGFDAAVGVLCDREIPGDWRVDVTLRVGALVGERIVHRVGFRDNRAVRRQN